MLIELSLSAMIAVDTIAWLLIHLGVARLLTALPAGNFNPDHGLFRARSWEAKGRIYEQRAFIRAWKPLLPDGAAWFRDGFPKARLTSTNSSYIHRFVLETCRGEAVHWMVLGTTPLFFIWNSWPMSMAMIIYALMANLPCILVQRYNRVRLNALRSVRRGIAR